MSLLLDRRSFLARSLATTTVLSCASRFSFAQPKPQIRWALLSDTHIAADSGDTYRGFHPHENLKQVLDQVEKTDFDLMLINGDLARLEGKPADYEMVTGYLDPLSSK